MPLGWAVRQGLGWLDILPVRALSGHARASRGQGDPWAPAKSRLRTRRSWPYTATTLRRGQALEQIRQSEQILGAKQRPPGGHDDERVGRLYVGPARRQRVDTLITWLAEEHPVLAPGVGEADQLVLLTLQGMERVGDVELPSIAAGSSS